MNKTVNINLSGVIFHIEEDAYLKLHSYLTTIKGYFSESEGRDEIMADIENRIAEMLSERVSDRKQVVLMTDVDHVIGVMGKPEDFAGEKSSADEPAKSSPFSSGASGRRRRLFRDPDNKILGGVCSGIGNFFNIDPVWLRLILVVCLFAFGTGILLYIVLWIVIPEAKTAAEKLEMKGEEVNFSNIGKKVEEEIQSFGKKVEDWGQEVKQTASSAKAGDAIARIFDFIGSVFGAFFRVFAKLVGVFIAIVGMLLLVGVISSLFGGTGLIHIDGESFSIRDGYNMFFENQEQEVLASFAIFLFIGIPLIMLVYGGVKLLLGIKTKNRLIGIGAGVLWLAGLLLVIVLGNQIAGLFSEKATSKHSFQLDQPNCDTLFLKVSGNRDYGYEHRRMGRHMRVKVNRQDVISADSAHLNFGFPELDIVLSETDSFEIVVYGESRGKDRKEALHLARSIAYGITQKDSLIEFSPEFSIQKNEKWRGQSIHIEVRVPKGKVVYLGKNMDQIIYDIKNESETLDEEMVGRRWIMGNEELRCLDCDGLDLNDRERRKHKRDKEDDSTSLPSAPSDPLPPDSSGMPQPAHAAQKNQK